MDRSPVLTLDRFDDCLRLGKRISEAPYLLPEPDILKHHEHPPAPRISEDIIGAVSADTPNFPPTPAGSSDSPRELSVFRNRAIMLSNDLNIGESISKIIKELVVASGGSVVDNLDKADVFVCQYRDGVDYVRASQEGKDVGNMSWLYHLITYNYWTSPMRRLLHYPKPRDGVPGFQGLIISVSNYTGDARLYLENLIKACGAEFTKTMRQDNTHLITAHTKSEKCDAAREWNIEVVNHLWLEESYTKFKKQGLSNKKFTHFPLRTHLGELVGKTQLDRKILEANFFPIPKERKAMNLKAEVPINRETRLDSADDPLHTVENLDAESMEVDGAPPTAIQKAKRNRDSGALQTPAARKFAEMGKENETPGSTGSRGAKARALSKLHESAADIALYDKERKRVGGVTHGRERGRSTETPESTGKKEVGGRKRKSTEMTEDEASEGEAVEPPARNGKRTKSDKLPPIHYRMVLTGYPRWTDNPKVEQSEKNTLRNLGILITEDTSNVDLLCAPKIVRTRKFVCALADSPEIVSPNFLDYCLKNNKVPDPSKYRLRDRDAEARLGITLKTSLAQAKANNHHLLSGWQVFCTDGVTGGFDTFKAIVEANGGTCMLYKGRTAMNVTKRSFAATDLAAESQGDDKGDTLYLISGDSKKEKDLWQPFQTMANSANMVPVIVKTDWLLSVAMQNVVHWDDKWEHTEK
jgi:hypothetical protein